MKTTLTSKVPAKDTAFVIESEQYCDCIGAPDEYETPAAQIAFVATYLQGIADDRDDTFVIYVNQDFGPVPTGEEEIFVARLAVTDGKFKLTIDGEGEFKITGPIDGVKNLERV